MADYYMLGLLLFALIPYTTCVQRGVRQAEVTTTVAPLANTTIISGNTSELNASHATTMAPVNATTVGNSSDIDINRKGNSSAINANHTTTSAPISLTSTAGSTGELTTGQAATTPAVNATTAIGSGVDNVTAGTSNVTNGTSNVTSGTSLSSTAATARVSVGTTTESSAPAGSKQIDNLTTAKPADVTKPPLKKEGKQMELTAAASDNVATSVLKPEPAETPVIQYPNADYESKAAPPPQNPDLLSALTMLRGRSAAASAKSVDMAEMLASAVAGKDYPNLSEIPDAKTFACKNVQQAGFYADIDTDCQVIRRCDINGNMWSYLCPNLTRFNQIELVCDWFWNIDCSQAKQFYDFSNSRLYHASWVFLDTPPNVANDGISTSALTDGKQTAQADAKASKSEKASVKGKDSTPATKASDSTSITPATQQP